MVELTKAERRVSKRVIEDMLRRVRALWVASDATSERTGQDGKQYPATTKAKARGA